MLIEKINNVLKVINKTNQQKLKLKIHIKEFITCWFQVKIYIDVNKNKNNIKTTKKNVSSSNHIHSFI